MAQMTRREALLGAAGLSIAFSYTIPALASPSTVAADRVGGYLAVSETGEVSVYAGKVDLGTGARAAIRQIVAEELGISPGIIDLVEGDTALTPDQGGTGGSTGIMVGGVQIRQAAATLRGHLIALAAARLNSPANTLDIVDGLVRPNGGGEGLGFGALLNGQTLNFPVDKAAKLRDPDTYKIVGTSYPRPDLPAKLTGRHAYVHHHRVDGMLHARVVRPPAINAKLLEVDAASIAAIPGARLVRVRDFLAVLAEREWDAVRALKAIKVRWSPATPLSGSDELFDTVRSTSVAREELLRSTGDAQGVLNGAANVLHATYKWPIQSHASMGPSCAVADIRDGGGTVWTATQATHHSRLNFARLLGLDPAKLRLIYMDGSGSYGRNGNDDAAFEAALLSKEIGRPVRVQWMRADEHGWDPKGPPQLLDLRGALGPAGDIAAWETVAMVPVNTGNAQPLLSAVSAGLDNDSAMFSGLTSLNSDPPYKIPNIRANIKWLTTTPLRTSNLRAPGKIGNVFAVESFFDELASAAGVDPFAFRLRGLTDERALDVLKRAASMIGWTPRTEKPGALSDIMHGRGMAYVHYKHNENYVALATEVEVTRASGVIRVKRVVCAHDCGLIINPDAVRAQIEGNILQTISRTLFEKVTFDQAAVTSTDWASYPILTFPDVPILEIELIDRPRERPVGAGEAAAAPVAAAIGNAVFDATGVRLREVPFAPLRVKTALSKQAT